MHITGRTNRTHQPGGTNTTHITAWTTRIHIGNKTHGKFQKDRRIRRYWTGTTNGPHWRGKTNRVYNIDGSN